MGFFFASFAIPNATLAWSDKIIVKEHDIITNKIELPTGLTFELSKDFLVADDLVTNLREKYQEGNEKYFFAKIELGLFTFASIKFERLDNLVKQENLIDFEGEQLKNYFNAVENVYLESLSGKDKFVFSNFIGEKKKFKDKIYLVSSYSLETDYTKVENLDFGLVEEVVIDYAYYDYPNGFVMTIRGVSDAKETLKFHAESIIDSLVFP